MIDALNTGECPPDRVLVGYLEFGRRGGGPQLRLSSFQPAQRTAHEYDAAATIDDHAGGGEANAGGSAGDDDCTAAESVKVVCDPLRHIPRLASMSRHCHFRRDRHLTSCRPPRRLAPQPHAPSLSGSFQLVHAVCTNVSGFPDEASAAVHSPAQSPSRSISSPVWTVNSTSTVLLGTPSTSAQMSTMRRPSSRRRSGERPRRISTSTIVIDSRPSLPRWNRLSSPSSAIPTFGRHNCVCMTSA